MQKNLLQTADGFRECFFILPNRLHRRRFFIFVIYTVYLTFFSTITFQECFPNTALSIPSSILDTPFS